MLKKCFALVLALVLALSLIACGSNAGSSEPASSDAQSTEDTADASAADAETGDAADETADSSEDAAAADEEEAPVKHMLGGWTASDSWVIDDEKQALFDLAMEGLLGVDYTPVAYLGSQLVSGTNHCFLCRAAVVSPDAVPYDTLVYIYQNLEGAAEIKNIVRIDLGVLSEPVTDLTAAVIEDAPEQLMGGWSPVQDDAMTDEISAAFTQVTEGLLGVNYTPAMVLASQVVSGTNYCILARAETVTAEPEAYYALLYIYVNLDGEAELLNVCSFDFFELSDYAVAEE